MIVSNTTRYAEIRTSSQGYWSFMGLLAVVALAGLGAAHHMDVEGHHVSGMNNQIVWGLPHVFAIFLIVAASGALNLASLASVFGAKVEGARALEELEDDRRGDVVRDVADDTGGLGLVQ